MQFKMSFTVVAALLGFIALIPGCDGPTRLDLVVEADEAVLARASRIILTVRTQEGGVALQEIFDPLATVLPIRRSVMPRGDDATRSVHITVQAVDQTGSELTTARLIRGFVPGRTIEVVLRLYDQCLGIQCPDNFTCFPSNGRPQCIDARIDPMTLDAAFDAMTDVTLMDGSTFDADVDGQTDDAAIDTVFADTSFSDSETDSAETDDALLSDAPGDTSSCALPLVECNGQCVELGSDPNHCGGCNRPCLMGQTCQTSICVSPSCLLPPGCASGSYCTPEGSCAPGCGGDADCGGGATCVQHECRCPNGTHLCGAVCADDTSVSSCGTLCEPCPFLTNASVMACGSGNQCIIIACTTGYQRSVDQLSCDDVNECAVGNGGCSVNATCWNTLGSRTCTCRAGFSGDGITCVPIDPGPGWLQESPNTRPAARSRHAMAYDLYRDEVVLFGGNASGVLDDTWIWNGADWAMASPPESPPARMGHAMAYHPGTGVTLLFGGTSSGGNALGDTWTWSGVVWQQQPGPMNSPGARTGHAMVYDGFRQEVVLFGGTNGNYLGDTWVYDGANWSLRTPMHAPPNRAGAAMAYDSARSLVVLFGGQNTASLNDTWTWNGYDWQAQTPALQPTPRTGHAMVFDDGRDEVLLFGGIGAGYLDDTWVWSGTDWLQRAPDNAPSGRAYHAMVYDSQQGAAFLFGGRDSANIRDTWTR